jgi:hypothetical protein
MQLSKSEFLQYLKHPLLLWLKKHDKAKLPPVDDNLQAIFDAGNLFESYAVQLFGDGTTIGFDSYDEYLSMPQRTKDALANGARTLFQARFEAGEITCISDVVIFIDDTECDLIEIKSGTSVKQENIYDLAFQTTVLERAGYKVRTISVLTANNSYVRHGDIDIEELCTIEEVTDDVRDCIKDVQSWIDDALAVVKQRTMPELSAPTAEEGDIYAWLDLYPIFNTIEPGSIFDLCWPKQRIADLHAMGITRLVDIPDDFKLSPKQQHQVTAAKTNEAAINVDEVAQSLSNYTFPLYFLDYETLASVIPPFDGMKPYDQLPFQYSLHVMDSPGAELRHYYYLHSDDTPPTKPLSESLIDVIGTSGTILTWNQSFEKRCNDLMGTICPEFKKAYKAINKRIDDLCIPFKNNSYVHKDFLGSYSIKKVLPVLVPELSYSQLDINEGGAAQRLWMGAVLDTKFAAQKDKILADLEKYCELDTLAMVRIYEVLVALTGDRVVPETNEKLSLF